MEFFFKELLILSFLLTLPSGIHILNLQEPKGYQTLTFMKKIKSLVTGLDRIERICLILLILTFVLAGLLAIGYLSFGSKLIESMYNGQSCPSWIASFNINISIPLNIIWTPRIYYSGDSCWLYCFLKWPAWDWYGFSFVCASPIDPFPFSGSSYTVYWCIGFCFS